MTVKQLGFACCQVVQKPFALSFHVPLFLWPDSARGSRVILPSGVNVILNLVPGPLLGLRAAHYHSVAQERRCASQQNCALMSQMGQERRIGAVRNISALPPRADVGADVVEQPVSAITSREQMLQERRNSPLFDHLVGAGEQHGRPVEAKRFLPPSG
jgi:hypothetical protein